MGKPIASIIRRISALQPHYSSRKTPEMQERGRLISRELPDAINEEHDPPQRNGAIWG